MRNLADDNLFDSLRLSGHTTWNHRGDSGQKMFAIDAHWLQIA